MQALQATLSCALLRSQDAPGLANFKVDTILACEGSLADMQAAINQKHGCSRSSDKLHMLQLHLLYAAADKASDHATMRAICEFRLDPIAMVEQLGLSPGHGLLVCAMARAPALCQQLVSRGAPADEVFNCLWEVAKDPWGALLLHRQCGAPSDERRLRQLLDQLCHCERVPDEVELDVELVLHALSSPRPARMLASHAVEAFYVLWGADRVPEACRVYYTYGLSCQLSQADKLDLGQQAAVQGGAALALIDCLMCEEPDNGQALVEEAVITGKLELLDGFLKCLNGDVRAWAIQRLLAIAARPGVDAPTLQHLLAHHERHMAHAEAQALAEQELSDLALLDARILHDWEQQRVGAVF